MLMGSGGGGNAHSCFGTAKNGGRGGGILFVMANSIRVSGSISANGAIGGSSGDAVSGSGAGGSIYLIANSMTLGNNAVSAQGGPGKSGSGAGGEGRIRLDYNSKSGTTTPEPGYESNITHGFYDFGTGADGNYVVTASTTVAANHYGYVTDTSLSIGTTTINLSGGGDAPSLAAGDEVLVIQMQNSTATHQWELKKVKSFAGNVLTLTSPLGYAYKSGTPNSTSAFVTQVVKVPQYSDVTINDDANAVLRPLAWGSSSGKKGGVLVFRATGTVSVGAAGKISATGKGFLGGTGVQSNDGSEMSAKQGESWNGLGSASRTSNQGGGGGAYAKKTSSSSGGGGGFATSGGAAVTGPQVDSTSWLGLGGGTYGSASLTNLFLGSGGGGASDTRSGDAVNGGNGGGIILIFAEKFEIEGKIEARGADSEIGDNYQSSGAGSGGSIYLIGKVMHLGTEGVDASGGDGGDGDDDTGYGGAGGDGRIRLDYNSFSGTSLPASSQSTTLGGFMTFTAVTP